MFHPLILVQACTIYKLYVIYVLNLIYVESSFLNCIDNTRLSLYVYIKCE